MKTIIDTCHYYMTLFPHFRLHRHRDEFVALVKRKHKEITGKTCSYESVTRAQRQLWSEGVCLPEASDFTKWLKSRGQRQTYIQFYGNKQQEV